MDNNEAYSKLENNEKSTALWNGYHSETFDFDGYQAIVVFPKNPLPGNPWLFKTEYFGAFPDLEIKMLSQGYFLAHVDTETRWCKKSDTDRQIAFAKFIQKEYKLNEKCIPVGMSCGGMQAVYLTAKEPTIVAGVYLDAPVLNLLSCPCGIGKAKETLGGMYDEYVAATGVCISELINCRNHPIDCVDKLISNKIPVFLVCGDSDEIVPYEENGMQLYEKYKKNNAEIIQVIKKDCNHHPHGLQDDNPLVSFVKNCYKNNVR